MRGKGADNGVKRGTERGRNAGFSGTEGWGGGWGKSIRKIQRKNPLHADMDERVQGTCEERETCDIIKDRTEKGRYDMTKEMQNFFEPQDDKYQRSLLVNIQLLSMPRKQLIKACHKFGLEPVNEYFDQRTLRRGEGNWAFRGFIRYLDAYLLEASGGKRTKLVQLGERMTGSMIKASSMRLIRMEVIGKLLLHAGK